MWIPYVFFLTILGVYLRTFCASFNINDSGETILVCTRLTISHSPGYPLHALWGKFNNVLMDFGQPMMRVTLASVTISALSVTLLYLILRKVFREALEAKPASKDGNHSVSAWLVETPALAGALMFAFSYQHWFQSGGAKGGIYTLNTFLTLFIVHVLLRMDHRGWAPKALICFGFLFGMGLAHHWPNQIVMLPGYFWLLFVTQKKIQGEGLRNEARRPTSIILFGATFFVASVAFLSQPPDGSQSNAAIGLLMTLGKAFLVGLAPVVIMMLLKVFEGTDVLRALWASTLGLTTYIFLVIRAHQDPPVNWWETVIRKGYSNIGDPRSWATLKRNLTRFWMQAQDQFGSLFTFSVIVLALVGFWWMWKRRRSLAIGFVLLGALVWGGIIVFNNPAEGYQWTLDNFFTPIYLVMAVFAAAGMACLLEFLREAWDTRLAAGILSVLTLLLGAFPLFLNWNRTDQSRYVSSYDYGLNMLKSVNRTGVILCNGDIDILPLWYMQFVLNKRPEVASLTMQLIPYEWYRNPLYVQYPFLAVPVGQDIRPQTVVQNMINFHAQERSFYFTNIFTASWMQEQNPATPEGMMWRIPNTKDLGYPLTSDRIDRLWSTYRIRWVDEPDRGYWDEYTDVMKDSYGIGPDYLGRMFLSSRLCPQSLWSFDKALRYRQKQTLGTIYIMLADVYLCLGNMTAAQDSAQKALEFMPGNPFAYLRMGQVFLAQGNVENARQAMQIAYQMAPQVPDIQRGMSLVEEAARKRSAPGAFTPPSGR